MKSTNDVLRERGLKPSQVRRLAGLPAGEHWCGRDKAGGAGNPNRCPLCAKEALEQAREEARRTQFGYVSPKE